MINIARSDLEKSILGTVLSSGRLSHADKLSPGHFSDGINSNIFGVFQSLDRRGDDITFTKSRDYIIDRLNVNVPYRLQEITNPEYDVDEEKFKLYVGRLIELNRSKNEN